MNKPVAFRGGGGGKNTPRTLFYVAFYPNYVNMWSTNRRIYLPMTGYTKLFGSIVASTIWREDDKTRIVWITMLAMANKYGDVEASVPGLADLSRVSLADVEKALESLAAPDKYSRTKDHEGRRIESIDGGWHILNHAKYRDKMSKDERREYLAQKKREQRERDKGKVNNVSTNVADGQPASTGVNFGRDIADADSDSKESRERAGGREREALIERIAAAYPRKDATFIVLQTIADRLDSGQDGAEMQRKVEACAFLIASAEGGSGNRFVPTAKKFFEDDQWKSPEAFKRLSEPKAKPNGRGTPETGVYKVNY